MRSYIVKRKHISLAVSEILLYRHTDRQSDRQINRYTSCYFNARIDNFDNNKYKFSVKIIYNLNAFIYAIFFAKSNNKIKYGKRKKLYLQFARFTFGCIKNMKNNLST